ncbi:hypothetical protein WUBG_00677 [Wuchereria bancrofti]|uniref:Uncharacterized protein n=1 Tax=Wuchereria bancrofti TaxID=6293 RepID=J9BLK5_WUCBA|nr:hypothetical protein WUBG_00677 [Wuchereria bancrofti]VDM09428.1 unnamed protein product [Wuchereria bancrofti]
MWQVLQQIKYPRTAHGEKNLNVSNCATPYFAYGAKENGSKPNMELPLQLSPLSLSMP